MISRREPPLGLKHGVARSSSGYDVREITEYSIRGFTVIEFESPGLRALIVRVTLDYITPRANSALRVFRPRYLPDTARERLFEGCRETSDGIDGEIAFSRIESDNP